MHFYTKTESGVIEPRHFVETKTGKNKGKLRASRLSDAKSALKKGELWIPSVTTILGVLDKPGLNAWRQGELLKSAYEIGSPQQMSFDEYSRAVQDATDERLELAPTRGTDFHNILEAYIQDGVEPIGLELKICRDVKALLQRQVTGDYTCEEYIMARDYAGCADLVVRGLNNWVIDYKTKDSWDKFKPGRMVYDDHKMQLAAYGEALFGAGNYRCANIFICIDPEASSDERLDWYEHSDSDVDRGVRMFNAANELFKIAKYDCRE